MEVNRLDFLDSLGRVDAFWNKKVLGEVGDYPLILLHSDWFARKPSVLIASGFHGDEPAPCLASLNIINSIAKSRVVPCNLAFLPLVNPTGFVCNKRINEWGEDPNRGFAHPELGHHASQEGKIILRNWELIQQFASDGFLSLHEDIEAENYYIYTFEDSEVPSDFSNELSNCEKRFFDPIPDGMWENCQIMNGTIFRACDGSLEDHLFHSGVKYTACTETPGLCNLNTRVIANEALIDFFIGWVNKADIGGSNARV